MAGVKRSKEERILIIDGKIAKKKAEIEKLEAQKNAILHPVTMKTLMMKMKEAGISPEEAAAKLELDL